MSGLIERAKRLAKRVVSVLIGLLPEQVVGAVVPRSQRFDPGTVPEAVTAPETPVRLYISPANSAGQAWQWARAVERNISGVGAVSLSVTSGPGFAHPVDASVPLGYYRWSRSWQNAQREAVTSGFTHAIIESAKPPFGDAFGGSIMQEIHALQRAGITLALLFHGSDIRLPSRHAEASVWSPFRDNLWSMTPGLELQATRNADLVRSSGLPVFFSTPDLILDLPHATWLPLTIDSSIWGGAQPPFSHDGPVRVAHAPSRAVVKGSDLIDPLLGRLQAEGVIDYVRVEGLKAEEIPGVYKNVDVVLDQFRIGDYGVAACEAMAAGRLVISHVSTQVRSFILDQTGMELPILQADASDLERTVRAVVKERTELLELSARGPGFVSTVHDGRRAASVLEPFLTSAGRGT